MNGSKVSLIEHNAQPVGQGRTSTQHVDHTVASYSPLTDKAIVIGITNTSNLKCGKDVRGYEKAISHVRRLLSLLTALTFYAGSL